MHEPGLSALVVGAGSGVGLRMAIRLAAAGWHVSGWSRRGAPLDAAGSVRFQQVDVRDADAVASALDQQVTAVVYAAAIACWGAAGDQSAGDWANMMTTNAVGAYTVLHEHQRRFGMPPRQVVGISSEAAFFPAAGRSGYHASKAALSSFLESYREEVRDRGTRVTVIYPGKINTELSQRAPEINALALQPDDIADTVLHLLSLPEHVEVRSLEIAAVDLPYKGSVTQPRQ